MIDSRKALAFLECHHPLGAGAKSIRFALGVFWNERLEGVLSFGCPISNGAARKYKLALSDVLELRKMWLSDKPTANAESRCLAISAMLIRKKYPQIKMLLTYCDSEEKAASYRGAGWIPQDAHQYIGEVRIGGKWLTVRNANRLGITKQATETKKESRRKWVLPLCASVAQLVERLSIQTDDGGSIPTRTLGTSETSKSPRLPLNGT